VWSMWSSRNNAIFSNGVIDPEEVINAIKMLSWRWGLSRHKIPVCLYYEWCWDPGLCLGRWVISTVSDGFALSDCSGVRATAPGFCFCSQVL
jgi:hypothetical protein